MVALGLAFLAGVLSILSPCVLPLLPIILGTAAGAHRFGPAVLAAGLALSFVAVGLFVATIGFSIGLDSGVFRMIAATLILAVGAVLLMPALQQRVALAAGPVSSWTENRFGGSSFEGLGGQFALGILLGAVWAPCVGPTLGAASVLAAQSQDLASVAAIMLAFGIGAALPLVLLGLLSREAFMRWRFRFAAAGSAAKAGLGLALVLLGLVILTGLDKRIETALVDASPDWLTALTTRF